MTVITEALIRKRAEHNDGILPDLEELALHQQEIEKIENFDRCCRHIRILLLQHNVISKMENLSKLKELEYLNLALNNVEKIENIEGCESLKKLDLTVNFIDVENFAESMNNLRANMALEDLYLVGNPCDKWAGYRQYVLASLPQLKQLDGTLIMPQERIIARQNLPALSESLEQAAGESLAKKARDKLLGIKPNEGAWTTESRLEQARELAEQKEAKEKAERERMGTADREPRTVPGVYNSRGEIRQCNEGKWNFRMDDWSDPTKIVLYLDIPRHLDTASLDVDVHPTYVRCIIKEKLTQLKLSYEVSSDTSHVRRSKITGQLEITMPVVGARPRPEVEAPPPELQPLTTEKEPKSKLKGAVSLDIVKREVLIKEQKPKVPDSVQRAREAQETFVDDPDVPPLEKIGS